MTARRPDLLNCPALLRPPRLLFCNRFVSSSRLESALLQVLIAHHLKSPGINTYEKLGGRVPRVLASCYSFVNRMPPLDPPAISSIKPFGITSFAAPCLVNPVESHLYQKQGRGVGLAHTELGSQPRPQKTSLSPLESTLTRHLASVGSKQLTAPLNPVNATLTNIWGGGYAPRLSSFIISSGQAPAWEAASAL
jgi:hypothetical protein